MTKIAMSAKSYGVKALTDAPVTNTSLMCSLRDAINITYLVLSVCRQKFPFHFFLREAAKIKELLFLMAVSLRPYPPPPLSLMAVGTFFLNKKKFPKKFIFLNGNPFPPIPPPPLSLMALPLRNFYFFIFAASFNFVLNCDFESGMWGGGC